MSDPIYDVVLRGGTVATATDIFQADVAVRGETVAALGTNLPQGRSANLPSLKMVCPRKIVRMTRARSFRPRYGVWRCR
jgi:dihydropyrimidinase